MPEWIGNIEGQGRAFEADKKRELPKDLKKIFVLFGGNPDEEKLSVDSRLRGIAVGELAKNNPEVKIFFVGGAVEDKEETSGSARLSGYFSSKNPDARRRVEVLEESNNTFGNMEEVISQLGKYSSGDASKEEGVAIVSSEYHLSRIRKIMEQLGLPAETISAEEVAKGKDPRLAKVVSRYESSGEYAKKKLLEKVGLLYMKVDPKEKLIELFRNLTRK